MKKIFKNNFRELSVIIAIVIMCVIFGALNPVYVSIANIVDRRSCTVLWVLALCFPLLPAELIFP